MYAESSTHQITDKLIATELFMVFFPEDTHEANVCEVKFESYVRMHLLDLISKRVRHVGVFEKVYMEFLIFGKKINSHYHAGVHDAMQNFSDFMDLLKLRWRCDLRETDPPPYMQKFTIFEDFFKNILLDGGLIILMATHSDQQIVQIGGVYDYENNSHIRCLGLFKELASGKIGQDMLRKPYEFMNRAKHIHSLRDEMVEDLQNPEEIDIRKINAYIKLKAYGSPVEFVGNAAL